MSRSDLRQEIKNSYLTIHRLNDENHDDNEHFPIENISRGGIRFSSEETFDLQERVSLNLYIDGKLSHQANGRICYHDEDNNHNNFYGVSFLDKYLHL